MAKPETITMPPSATASVRDAWMRLQGAIAIAQSMQSAIMPIEAAYKQQFRTCLEMLGLDPEENWEIDFRTGEVRRREGQPNLAQPNGAMLAPTLPGS